MHHQEYLPPQQLQDSIRCFWYNRRDVGEQTEFEVQPDGYAEIIFYFGKLSLVGENGKLTPLPSPFMMGLLNQPAVFNMDDRLEVIAVRCFPWTVFDLLGLPSSRDGVHTFQHPIARLQPALNECIRDGRIEDAITEVTQYFLNAHAHIPPNSMLYKAGVAIRKANGAIPVSEVAGAAHATVRTLERNFKQSSGHTVKDVAALIRFEQVRNRLWHQPDVNLAGLAHELGYTDQSHLSREFKRYSGATPAAFARNARKDRLAVNNDFVAFIQS